MIRKKEKAKWTKVTPIIISISLATLITVSALQIHNDVVDPWTCAEKSTLTKILELRYRDAVIELKNGKNMTVNQASLKLGDEVCIRYGRKN